MSFDLSKTNFLNSIQQQMNTFGVGAEKQAELKSEANSIFSQFDKQNADGTENVNGDGSWNSTENNNAGSILSKFMQSIAESASDDFGVATGTKKSPATNPITDITAAYTEALNTNTINPQQAEIEKIKSMSPNEQIEYVLNDLEEIITQGGNIINFDGDNLTTEFNGETKTISLSSMGLGEEAINEIKPLITDYIEGEKIDAELDEFEAQLINQQIMEVTGYSQNELDGLKELGLTYEIGDNNSIIIKFDGKQTGSITQNEDGEMIYDSGAIDTTLAVSKQKARANFGEEVGFKVNDKELILIYEKDGVKTNVVIDKNTGKTIRYEKDDQ